MACPFVSGARLDGSRKTCADRTAPGSRPLSRVWEDGLFIHRHPSAMRHESRGRRAGRAGSQTRGGGSSQAPPRAVLDQALPQVPPRAARASGRLRLRAQFPGRSPAIALKQACEPPGVGGSLRSLELLPCASGAGSLNAQQTSQRPEGFRVSLLRDKNKGRRLLLVYRLAEARLELLGRPEYSEHKPDVVWPSRAHEEPRVFVGTAHLVEEFLADARCRLLGCS